MGKKVLKRFALRLAGVSLSFAIGLGIVEGALRILPAGGDPPRSTAVKATSTARFWKPDFRGRPRPGEKPAGTFRVLVVGDSFTWGAGVYPEDVYPARLERRLNELESEVEFEVVNWSHAGWNAHQAFGSVKKAMDWLEPDLLIFGFVLNDAEPVSMTKRDRMQEVLARRLPRHRLSGLLHQRSRLYRLIWERLENTRQRRAFIDYYHSLYEGGSWDVCRLTLERFRDRSRRLSIPLVLVIFPVFDTQLDSSYPYADLHGVVSRAARELEIPVLDLLRTYRGIDARRLAVTPFTNPHPSELAHRVAADRLVKYLLKSELVPAQRLNSTSASSPAGARGSSDSQGPQEGLQESAMAATISSSATSGESEGPRPSVKGEDR